MPISDRDVREEFKQAQAQGGGQQLGGGAGPADQDAAGGSSGTGGYGNAQNQSFHQGQTSDHDKPATRELSRGERYDMEQGGGRSADSVDFEEELKEDQRAGQDPAQAFIGGGGDPDAGAVTEGQQP